VGRPLRHLRDQKPKKKTEGFELRLVRGELDTDFWLLLGFQFHYTGGDGIVCWKSIAETKAEEKGCLDERRIPKRVTLFAGRKACLEVRKTGGMTYFQFGRGCERIFLGT